MGRHWVKALKPITRYALEGGYFTYQPGDWFECRNQEMFELLAQRAIETTTTVLKRNFRAGDAGVLVVGDVAPLQGVDAFGIKQAHADAPELRWERTVIYGGTPTTAESVALGLMRVSGEEGEYPGWEMAAMLESFEALARDVGSDADHERTLELLGDLRLPVYDTGLVWVRRTEATEEVIQLWRDELATGADPRHAFLRAIYQRRVVLCTLPARWVGKWVKE